MADVNSDEEERCDECAPNPIITPFRQRSCFERGPIEWILFGKVKHLFIYPVEYGTGVEEPKVICTSNGPEFDTFDPSIRNIKDRRLLVYKKNEKHIKKEDRDTDVYLSASTNRTVCAKTAFFCGSAKEFEEDTIHGKEVIHRKYDIRSDVELIRRPSDREDFPNFQKSIEHTNAELRLGYFTTKSRKTLIDNFRFTNENMNIEGMLPNYSHYTLINTKSLDYLKFRYQKHLERKKINENSKQISHKNFFPHIVVEGKTCSHYQEDSIKRVKIGNVEFGNILPCLQGENVNFNHVNHNKPFSLLLKYLEKKRKIQEIHNDLDDESERAVFGINMEKLDVGFTKDDENKIAEGDLVFVKY